MFIRQIIAFGFLSIFVTSSAQAAAENRIAVQARGSFGFASSTATEKLGRHEGYALQAAYHIPAGDVGQWVLGVELGQGKSKLEKEYTPYSILTTPVSDPVTIHLPGPKAVLDMNWSVLAKAGYGLRLGQRSLAMVSLGAGLASGTIDVENSASRSATDQGFIWSFDVEGQFSVTESYFITAGASQRAVRYSFDTIDPRLTEEFQANTSTLSLGGLILL